MAILALAATIVIINAPPRQSASRAAAAEFADALRASVDDAIVGGGVHRLEVTSGNWRIAEFDDRDWTAFRQGGERDLALTINVKGAAESNLPALTGERAERRERDAPTIIAVDPFGDAPSFEMRFRDERESWVVRRGENGDIRVERE